MTKSLFSLQEDGSSPASTPEEEQAAGPDKAASPDSPGENRLKPVSITGGKSQDSGLGGSTPDVIVFGADDTANEEGK